MTARDDGFTLLEVIVALAILSIAVVASIQAFAQGLRLLKLSGDHQRAMLYADLKLREVVTPEEGHEAEDDPESGFRWERDTTIVETPEADDGTTLRWRVVQITVRVRWDERRQVELATLRTVSTASLEPSSPPGGVSQQAGTPTPRDDAPTASSPSSPFSRGSGPPRSGPSAPSRGSPGSSRQPTSRSAGQ